MVRVKGIDKQVKIIYYQMSFRPRGPPVYPYTIAPLDLTTLRSNEGEVLRARKTTPMKFEFKPVSRILEDALGVAAFEVSLDGKRVGVAVNRDQIERFLAHHDHDLRADEEAAGPLNELLSLVCSDWGDIATRVREAATQSGLGDFEYVPCEFCGAHGDITRPFENRSVRDFGEAFRMTSESCCAETTPVDVGIALLKHVLAKGLQLKVSDEPTIMPGAMLVISVKRTKRPN